MTILTTKHTQHPRAQLMHNQAIMSLKPKQALLSMLPSMANDWLDVDDNQIKPLLNQELLENHTVPVCTPAFKTPNDLERFIENNNNTLLHMMLSAWPFPINGWYFTDKNNALFNQLVEIHYYPILYNAMTKPVQSTLDLTVTFATPTNQLVDYILDGIHKNKITLSKTEEISIAFYLSTGIAIITNRLEKSDNQDIIEYILSLNDSRNFLKSLQDHIVTTLFTTYFKRKSEFPKERTDAFLNQWFETKTYLSLHQLT